MNSKQVGIIINNGLYKERISQKELAEKLDLNPSSVAHWVRGDSMPTAENLIKIVSFLNIQEEIFGQPKQSDTSKLAIELKKRVQELEEKVNKQEEISQLSEQIERKEETRKNIAKKFQIAVIEDDADSFNYIHNCLTDLNCPAYIACYHSCDEALKYLESTGKLTSLIILDIKMNEGIDGVEFLRRISKKGKRCIYPVILCSGHEDKILEAQRYCDTSHVLKKPFELRDLKLILAKIDLNWPLVLKEIEDEDDEE